MTRLKSDGSRSEPLRPGASRKRALMVLCLMAVALSSWALITMNRIDINVVLQADGSARMTEVWDVDVAQATEYTELYQTRQTHSVTTIEDFTVSEQGREFILKEDWDTKASDKEGKCGLKPISSGYELCWGIGKPGHHRYTLNYTITRVLMPCSAQSVALDMVIFEANALLPREASVTISRADSVLTSADVEDFVVNEENATGGFEKGRFVVRAEHAMEKNDWLGVHIVFPATAFPLVDRSSMSTDIAPEEMTSPMMQDAHAGRYEESWIDKFWDFYHEWPLLTLFGILGGLIGLFYVVRKIAVALA